MKITLSCLIGMIGCLETAVVEICENLKTKATAEWHMAQVAILENVIDVQRSVHSTLTVMLKEMIEKGYE